MPNPNILEEIKGRIKNKEGCKLVVYLDTRKVVTVGWGHKVLPSDGLFLGDTITQQRADQLFAQDFADAIAGVKVLVPDFDNKPDYIKIVLVDMRYNNGEAGLANFKQFLKAVNANNWAVASNEIVDSDNYRSHDLHSRYVELETMVRECV